jgi:hypothetical protein
VIARFSSEILVLLKFIVSIQRTQALADVSLHELSLVLVDFFNSFLSPKISERQEALPPGKQLAFGLVTREVVKSVTAGSASSIGSLAPLETSSKSAIA